MLFADLAEHYDKIESTTKRLEMTEYLIQLLKATPIGLFDKVVYLTLGQLYPAFMGVELGIADKLALRSLSKASRADEKELRKMMSKLGDLGSVAEKVLARKSQAFLESEPLEVGGVYESLDRIAKTSGEGAVDAKVQTLSVLLSSVKPKEAKYILRMVTGKLRLGVADMTILDALAELYGGGKEKRVSFERAYNLSSDIGLVARTAASKGVDGVRSLKIRVGNPVRPMLAERLSSAEEILQKLGGKGLVEFKYDGERLQIHKKSNNVTIFSRRQENITSQYPDVIELCTSHIRARECIAECEAVAVDADTGDLLPFQELMHRRRKYEIEKVAGEYPVVLFFFDLLYSEGKDMTLQGLAERRRILERVMEEGERIKITESVMAFNEAEVDRFFQRAIEAGCEGVIVKSVAGESVYRAGARGWSWIKYKRDYKSELTDTVDLVVVGALYGRGRRSGKYGALLMACFEPERDIFTSVTKCGSGFKDEDLEKLLEVLKPYRIKSRHARVESGLEVDVWFEPKVVLEVLGAEITVSPTHKCAWNKVREGFGLAVRFPRFTGKYRFDKSAEDSTTAEEIVSMYMGQLKKVAVEKGAGGQS